jgi:hypothetical protein
MKKTMILGLILSMILGGCTQEKKSPLDGEWILAHEYEIANGVTTVLYPGDSEGNEIKIWSGDYWVLLGRFEQDSGFTQNYGGGTYRLDGNRYEEIVQYHSAPQYLDQTVKLWVEFKKDTIIQTWPVDENGEVITTGSYYIEKWARIK